MTDPIADMLTRIRNAIAVGKADVSLPHSRLKEALARLLKDSGFLFGVHVEGEGIGKTLALRVSLPDKPAVITEIKRVSKPGRHFYVSSSDIPTVKRGRGLVIISTSKGMMTGEQAKAQHIGGELMCRVY